MPWYNHNWAGLQQDQSVIPLSIPHFPPSLPPPPGRLSSCVAFFFFFPAIFITLNLAGLATKDSPGDTKQHPSSMIAQGILGFMRPLCSGLNASKTRFIFLCGMTEQNCMPAKQVSRRGFSSTCKLQGAPRESRWVKGWTIHHCVGKGHFKKEMHWPLPHPTEERGEAGTKHDL